VFRSALALLLVPVVASAQQAVRASVPVQATVVASIPAPQISAALIMRARAAASETDAIPAGGGPAPSGLTGPSAETLLDPEWSRLGQTLPPANDAGGSPPVIHAGATIEAAADSADRSTLVVTVIVP